MTRTLQEVPAENAAIRFEVRHGNRRINCTVLDEALQAAAGLTEPMTTVLRRGSFDRFRMLIDAAAKLKMEMTNPSTAITLSSTDLRRVPTQHGAPAFGSTARFNRV